MKSEITAFPLGPTGRALLLTESVKQCVLYSSLALASLPPAEVLSIPRS